MPVGLGFLSAFLKLLAGVTIDFYSAQGSTDIATANDASENPMADMNITVTDCKAGDILEIHFDGTIRTSGATPTHYAQLRVKVDGATVGLVMEFGRASTTTMPATRHPANVHRVYEVPADGDYTVIITWRQTANTSVRYRCHLRTLKVKRIRGA